MNPAVFFSIIIPTLNEEKYLPRLLKSLAKQTYKDFEVIVVDGRSNDKTCQVFEKLQKNLPSSRLIISENRNVAAQRNLGGKEAKGSYLVFFDADVDIQPTFLEEVHVACVKKKFPLATTYLATDSRKSVDQLMITLGNLIVELAKGINRPFSGGYNTIVKKEIFDKLHGFGENMTIGEDHDFVLRALEKNIEIIILKEPKVVFSLRRFRSEGTLQVLRKYTQAQIYSLVKGPITHELFDYPMGGHVHKRRRKKIDLTKFNTYIKTINKLQRGLINLLKE